MALFDCVYSVGDASFEGEDIPPIAGLLKLFLVRIHTHTHYTMLVAPHTTLC